MKFFTFLDIYLERVLLNKMKESMEKYLKFILQFVARSSRFQEMEDYAAVGLDEVAFSAQGAPLTEIKL